MVRQFLQGQNFFLQEFGKPCSEVGWGPSQHTQEMGALGRGPPAPEPLSHSYGCPTPSATQRSSPRSCAVVASSAS